ncbi:MAG: hypothetical protein WKF43_02200 [Acidimicrobiales bacterium]
MELKEKKHRIEDAVSTAGLRSKVWFLVAALPCCAARRPCRPEARR